MAITRDDLVEKLQEILQPDTEFKDVKIIYREEDGSMLVAATVQATEPVLPLPTTEEPN